MFLPLPRQICKMCYHKLMTANQKQQKASETLYKSHQPAIIKNIFAVLWNVKWLTQNVDCRCGSFMDPDVLFCLQSSVYLLDVLPNFMIWYFLTIFSPLSTFTYQS